MDEYFEQSYTDEVEKDGDILNANTKIISWNAEDIYLKAYRIVTEMRSKMEKSKRLLQ
jgi:hypothetical protein